MISVSGLTVRAGDKPLITDVTARISRDRTTAVLGPNGCGKSTLLTALYRGFEAVSSKKLRVSGTVHIDDTEIHQFSRPEIARTLSVVPQSEPDHPGLRAIDVVDLGRSAHRGGFGRSNRTTDDERICFEALGEVGIAHHAYQYFSLLSGGEKQRVILARAIAQGGSFMLLDEPTNHLDLRHQMQLMGFLAQHPATMVIVLHDLNLALRSCDDAIILNQGRVFAQGPIHEVLTPEVISEVWGVTVELISTSAGQQFAMLAPVDNWHQYTTLP